MARAFQFHEVPTSREDKVDEFKKLLSLALKGDPVEAEAASKKLLAEFRVKVVRPPLVRSFSIH
jgi:hypothetical protein